MKKLISQMQSLLAATEGAESFAAAFADATAPNITIAGQSDATAFAGETVWADQAAPATRALANLVQDGNCLGWAVPYGNDPMAGRNFAERSAYCMIAGPGAPVEHSSIACGFFMVGPDVDYNDHQHGPVELYLPLSGTARYWSEGHGWQTARPGQAMVHGAWEWHALQTRDQPILILWMWHLIDGEMGPMPVLSNRHGGAVIGATPGGST